MVFFGYELPRQNYSIRLNNLKTSLSNANTLTLNNIYQKEQKLLNLPIPSAITNATPSIFTPNVLKSSIQQVNIDDFKRSAITPKSLRGSPTSLGRAPNLLDELKSKLAGTQLGLKRGLSKPEAEFKSNLEDLINKRTSQIKDKEEVKVILDDILNKIEQNDSERKREITTDTIADFLKKKAIRDNKGDIETESISSNDPTISSQVDLDILNKKLATLNKENIKNFEDFKVFFNTIGKLYESLDKTTHKNTKLPLEDNSNISFNSSNLKSKISKLKESFQYFQNNPASFKQDLININNITGISAMGITGGRLVSGKYYNSNAPNFGNLYINQKSLKKNNLVISRPYSKTQLLSKKNISKLLKKMIFDIANTLEFDKQDYYNLDKDEKIIIEKIIRLQKDMKDVNIEKLLEDDDTKIKKRIAILIAEVNAGNHSSLIKKELENLLKKLYDNKAISYTKYKSSLKSIKNLD